MSVPANDDNANKAGAHSAGSAHSAGNTGYGDRDVHVNVPQRGDQVRWGPVWAGVAMILPVFLLGGLIFLAVGVLDAGGVSGTTGGVVTGLIALLAFFVGGLVAAATAMWRGVDTGLLHGILVWALGITAFLFLTILGAGSLLGSAGSIASQLLDPATVAGAAGQIDPNQVAAQAPSAAEVSQAGQSAASYGVLGLGLTFIASALGGVVGAKFWPRKKGDDAARTSTD